MNKLVIIPLAVLVALSCPLLATPDSDEGDEPTRPVKIHAPAQPLTFRVYSYHRGRLCVLRSIYRSGTVYARHAGTSMGGKAP